MIIATWNVNGVRSRAVPLAQWLRTHQPDVVCLQEIRAHPDQVPESVKSIPGYHSHWHGTFGGYSGVSMHVRCSQEERPEFTVPFFDHETRILQADIGSISAINVYVPLGQKSYGEKLAFFESLIGYVDALQYGGRQVVLCGDFNVAHTDDDVHPELLREGRLCTRPEERHCLDALVRLGMVDLFRKHNPRVKSAYSWWPYFGDARARNVGWRIDYIFATSGIAVASKGCRIHREEGSSDHSPVIAEIAA